MAEPAYAYLRVSGKGQVDGDGFTRQTLAIRKYAAEHGYEITKEFRDEGVSGTKDLEDRPALTDLVATIVSNGAKTVIIEKLDRLARDLMVQETIIGDLKRRGIQIVSVAEPDLLSDDPTRKLLRQMMGAIAEYEKTIIVARLRGARKRMKARGERCEGQKPYGFRPGEAETVERIRDLRAAGYTYAGIAEVVRNEGRLKRNGRTDWHPMQVKRICEAV